MNDEYEELQKKQAAQNKQKLSSHSSHNKQTTITQSFYHTIDYGSMLIVMCMFMIINFNSCTLGLNLMCRHNFENNR